MKQNRSKMYTGLVFIFLCVASIALALPTHLNRMKNPAGCAGCHAGHGQKGTHMLKTAQEKVCFTCHGPSSRGTLTRTDMLSVFNKRSRHPVLTTAMFHSAKEQLPEKNHFTRRHVACQDCHSVHYSEPEKSWKRISGYSREMTRKAAADEEYQLCYKCHSDSANLPLGSKNKREEFSINNASYHPIESAGKNKRVPSLIQPMNVSSRINCSDCHGNNDPYGPKGPHGSDNDFMLKDEYVMTETGETPRGYGLCYACHDRRSILGNESFQRHKEHIVYYHTPCSSCHTPHGSAVNPHLIGFDDKFVGLVSMASYVPALNGKPKCYLKCHVGGKDVLHDNAFYTGKRWP